MAYTFPPLSSPDSDDSRQVDCTAHLKTLELLASVTVTSLDTTILTISDEAVNTTLLTKDDGVSQIAIGKGFSFTVSSERKAVEDVPIKIVITGDASTPTVKSYTIIQPVVETLTS